MRRNENLPIRFETRNGTTIAKVLCETFGSFDVAAISKHTFKLIQSGCEDFVFDLDCVQDVSTASVAFLNVTREKIAEVAGDLKLVNLSERVVEILRFCRLYDTFQPHIVTLDDLKPRSPEIAHGLQASSKRARNRFARKDNKRLLAVARA